MFHCCRKDTFFFRSKSMWNLQGHLKIFITFHKLKRVPFSTKKRIWNLCEWGGLEKIIERHVIEKLCMDCRGFCTKISLPLIFKFLKCPYILFRKTETVVFTSSLNELHEECFLTFLSSQMLFTMTFTAIAKAPWEDSKHSRVGTLCRSRLLAWWFIFVTSS